eukprot:TRINITY_DN10105_c0_g1_i1.p3 TRINITY_DN10105_c0_g1~~TRINITY_DN10105_c0_g1_i1.p3  ORF type:complete len:153 (-),score=25.00 TRINITY_DN10105_c0_g1_i1:247-705(-)
MAEIHLLRDMMKNQTEGALDVAPQDDTVTIPSTNVIGEVQVHQDIDPVEIEAGVYPAITDEAGPHDHEVPSVFVKKATIDADFLNEMCGTFSEILLQIKCNKIIKVRYTVQRTVHYTIKVAGRMELERRFTGLVEVGGDAVGDDQNCSFCVG